MEEFYIRYVGTKTRQAPQRHYSRHWYECDGAPNLLNRSKRIDQALDHLIIEVYGLLKTTAMQRGSYKEGAVVFFRELEFLDCGHHLPVYRTIHDGMLKYCALIIAEDG